MRKCNGPGPGLSQSTPSGVNIAVMKKDLEALNTLWNTLKQAMAEMDGFQRLHIAIHEEDFFRKATLLYELIIRWLVVHKVSSVIRQPPLSP